MLQRASRFPGQRIQRLAPPLIEDRLRFPQSQVGLRVILGADRSYRASRLQTEEPKHAKLHLRSLASGSLFTHVGAAAGFSRRLWNAAADCCKSQLRERMGCIAAPAHESRCSKLPTRRREKRQHRGAENQHTSHVFQPAARVADRSQHDGSTVVADVAKA